jgi:hypothetical protein
MTPLTSVRGVLPHPSVAYPRHKGGAGDAESKRRKQPAIVGPLSSRIESRIATTELAGASKSKASARERRPTFANHLRFHEWRFPGLIAAPPRLHELGSAAFSCARESELMTRSSVPAWEADNARRCRAQMAMASETRSASG